MSQVTVAMFNANPRAVTVSVNAGSAFTIGPTSSAISWRPVVPAVAPGFVAGPATPGKVGIGQNSIGITPSGWTEPQFFPFNVPGNVPITSLQIYIYWNQTTGSCQALFANSGQVFYQSSGQSAGVSPGP